MTLNAILHYSAACFCFGLAVFALLRDHRAFVHRIFAAGMTVLALESFFTGLSAQIISPAQVIVRQQWRSLAMALLPGIWLLFSLSLARGDYRPLLAKWKWAIFAVFLLPLGFVSLFQAGFFQGDPVYLPNGWELGLGWSGYGFYVCLLLSLVLLMMILEKKLRESRGRLRWQLKFLVIGIGGIFAVRIYTGSHILIFQTVNLELEIINAAVLLVAAILILISILRAGSLRMDIYLSQKMLFNSLTLIVVGVYFLALGVSAKTFEHFLSFPQRTILIFLALLGLLLALLSDRLRLKLKQFVSRHLRRPQYDYRDVWMSFTRRTAALLEEKALCEAVVKMICEMFDILSVSIWLLVEKREDIRCAGSTAFSETRAANLPQLQTGAADILRLLRDQPTLLDLEEGAAGPAAAIKRSYADLLQEARMRYLVPLTAGGDLLGFISLGDRVKGRSLSLEELDMLRTIAEQVAASLLNLKLAENLHQAKEMEAFQTIAAFFVHDLKNLASKLSMMFKNLPVHFDNPEFRDDALRLMSRSVAQIDDICRQLSLLREKLEIRPVETDLNEMVTAALANLNGFPAGCLVKNLRPLPKVMADPEQMQKVLTNLILNAADAVGQKGEICISTLSRGGWVELGVSDTGCGISKEFMGQCLFRPFKTTKAQGTGIGLFQSKMIVEAHDGVIEVESREGEGSTFRVLLPVKGPAAD
jgi:putative PEP-CTERM system histidine kinase